MTRPILTPLISLACALAMTAPLAAQDQQSGTFGDARDLPGTYVPSTPARSGTDDAQQPRQLDDPDAAPASDALPAQPATPPLAAPQDGTDQAGSNPADGNPADGTVQPSLFAGGALIQPSGLKYGLATSADPRATEVGMQILRQGGSASDAAMAMMLALTVVEPQSSGIGGGGFLLHASGTDGTISTVDGRETAPIAARADRFLGPDGQPLPFVEAFQGGRSVGVPGNIRLMAMVHEKWGKLPWADLFEPAIQLASGGFEVNRTLEGRLQQIAPLWDRFPDAKAVFWKDGAPAKEGDLITNPKLAETFDRLAELGADAFYSGQTASEILNTVRSTSVNPGDMTQDDLTAYAAKERPAVCMPYRTYNICGMGPPSSGGATVLQILGMLENYDMAELGSANPASWHLIGEAMQLAYADRAAYLGDPSFVYVPMEGLLDKDYLKQRAALIQPDSALGTYEAGTPPQAEPRTPAPSSEVPGTTNFVAVDKDGNVVTMTSTVEGAFGSQLMAGGFFLNNELTDFTFVPEKDGLAVANAVKAGKRPLSSMSPTIVYDSQGRPVLALGSAGGKRIIMHVVKTLIGYLDWDYPLEEAIALPNIFFGGDGLIVEQGTPLVDLAPQIEALGQPVVIGELPSKVNAARWTEDGWQGAADPRGEGTVEAE